MTIITITTYLLSALFLFFLAHAIIRVVKQNRRAKSFRKRSDNIKLHQDQLKAQGLKPFTFENGKVILYSRNFKEANAQFVINRKNGMYNL